MLFGYCKSVQRGQASRASSVFDAQLASDTSQELGNTSLHWQRPTQEKQLPGLHRFNVSAERSWGARQDYAKVFQPLFGADVRCVGGHYRFSVDLLEVAGHIAIAAARQQLPPTQMGAAVDVQYLAGDLARLRKIEHGLGNVLGSCNLPKR